MKAKINTALFCISSTLLIFWSVNPWPYFALFLSFIGITVWGSFDIRMNYFLTSFNYKKNCTEKIVALTFDDGPSQLTPKFLEILAKYQARASFFCIGLQAQLHPEILREINIQGHEIGGHSFHHNNSHGFLSTEKLIEEIQKTDRIFEENGIKSRLYRPPFGVTNPNIAKAVKTSRKFCVGWNVRSLDTVLRDEHKIASRILRKLKPGSIILMHDTSEKSLRALEILLLNLQKQQYRCCTISELWNYH